MGSLVLLLALLLLVGLPTGAWLTRRQYRQARVQRIRDQARLKAVESQIGASELHCVSLSPSTPCGERWPCRAVICSPTARRTKSRMSGVDHGCYR